MTKQLLTSKTQKSKLPSLRSKSHQNVASDGPKPALVERLEEAIQQQKEKKMSNAAFHSVHPRLESTRKKVTQKEEALAEHEARLAVARTELETTKTELSHAQRGFKELEPRVNMCG